MVRYIMRQDEPEQPLSGTKIVRDFVLGQYKGKPWIGVRFGEKWKPARPAGQSDIKFFN